MNSIVIDGNETFDFVNAALNSINVNDIEFRYCDFTNEDLLKLIKSKQYNRVAFIDCAFENETLIKNIITKSLSLTTSKISNYNFIYEMTSLENLTVVKGNIDAHKLNNLNNLEYLRLSHSHIINSEKLSLDKIKYLFIDNTNIYDISFIKKLSNLELLSISENQKAQNEEFIKTIKKQVKIILDSIIEMEVSYDE